MPEIASSTGFRIPPDFKVGRLADRTHLFQPIDPETAERLARELVEGEMRTILSLEKVNALRVSSAREGIAGNRHYFDHVKERVANLGNVPAWDRAAWQREMQGAEDHLRGAYEELDIALTLSRDTSSIETSLKRIASALGKSLEEVREMHRGGFADYLPKEEVAAAAPAPSLAFSLPPDSETGQPVGTKHSISPVLADRLARLQMEDMLQRVAAGAEDKSLFDALLKRIALTLGKSLDEVREMQRDGFSAYL